MNKTILNITFLFVCMLLLQVIIFNHIILFGVAYPFVFIYFIIRMKADMNTNLLLLLSFLLGFLVDIWLDTPGVNALGSTILAMLKKPVLYMYASRDERFKAVVPSISSLGLATYSKFILTMSAIFSVIVFLAEYMSFANIERLLLMMVSSTVFTFTLLLGFDSLFSIKRNKNQAREKRL